MDASPVIPTVSGSDVITRGDGTMVEDDVRDDPVPSLFFAFKLAFVFVSGRAGDKVLHLDLDLGVTRGEEAERMLSLRLPSL